MTFATPQQQQEQSQPPQPQEWFYAHQGQQRGPVALETLRAMLAGGQVMWTEMVWTAGMANWVPANTVAQLKPGPTSQAGGPPPLPPQTINYAGPPPPGAHRDIGENAGMRMLMPVGRSPWAIVAGYLGLLSPLLIFAPFALIVSIMAMRDIKRRNTHGMGRAVFGLIMGGLFSIVLCLAVVATVMSV